MQQVLRQDAGRAKVIEFVQAWQEIGVPVAVILREKIDPPLPRATYYVWLNEAEGKNDEDPTEGKTNESGLDTASSDQEASRAKSTQKGAKAS